MALDRILVRAPNWIGDAVMAVPAIRVLRHTLPQSHITIMGRPWVAGVFQSAEFVDEVWSQTKPTSIADWWRLRREIARRGYAASILLPNSFESALTVYLGRIPERIGYATDGRRLLLTQSPKPPTVSLHQIEYYLELVAHALVATHRTPTAWMGGWTEICGKKLPLVQLAASARQTELARELLRSNDITGEYVVINPGAAYGSAKRWPDSRFAEAADRIAGNLGLPTVIVGSEGERPIAESIRLAMKTRACVLSGQTTLEALIGVLAGARVMVTNDSGPMHIAAALGTPTVAIFGSTDDRQTGPSGLKTRIVRTAVECSPCLLRECPIDHRCMTRVAPETVAEAALEIAV